jgi:hypothetical protein
MRLRRTLLRRAFPLRYEILLGMLLALSFYLISWAAPATWGTGLIICWAVSLALVTYYVDFVSGVIALVLILASGFAISMKILTSYEVIVTLFIISALYPVILVSKARRPQPRQAMGAPAPQAPPQAPARQRVLHDVAWRISRALLMVGVSVAAAFALLLLSLLIPMWMVAIIGFMVMVILFWVGMGVGGITLALILLLAILYFAAPEFRLITVEQVEAFLVLAIAMCAAGAIIWRAAAASPPPPAPGPQPSASQAQAPQAVATSPAARTYPLKRYSRELTSTRFVDDVMFPVCKVGAYTPSGLEIIDVEVPFPRTCKPEFIPACLEINPSTREVRLSLMDREVVFRGGVKADLVIGALHSLLPEGSEKSEWITYEYEVDEEDIRRALAGAYGNVIILRIRRRVGDGLAHPLRVKAVRASDYVGHKIVTPVPEELHIPLYGSALHAALEALVRERSIERALDAYMGAARRERLFKILYEEPLKSGGGASGVRPAPPLEEFLMAGRRALELFAETDIYREFNSRYEIPGARLILIGSSIGVFAQPDFKSKYDEVIYDVKAVDPRSSPREVLESIRLQMRVFQLAYPGARAVVIYIPYNGDRIMTAELDPLTYDDVKELLPELEGFCMERGQEAIIRDNRTVILRYLKGEGEIRLEVRRPIKVRVPDESQPAILHL